MKNINSFEELVETFGADVVGAGEYWVTYPAKDGGKHWINLEGKDETFIPLLFSRKSAETESVIIFEGVTLDGKVALHGGNVIGARTTISHSTLMQGAAVGSDCDISDTTMDCNSIVESGTRRKTKVVSSILEPKARVGSDSNVSDSKIGYGAVVESNVTMRNSQIGYEAVIGNNVTMPENIVRQGGKVAEWSHLPEDYTVPSHTYVYMVNGKLFEIREPRFMLSFDTLRRAMAFNDFVPGTEKDLKDPYLKTR